MFSINGAIDKNGNLSGTIDVGRTMGGTLTLSGGHLTGNVKSIYPDGSYYINEVNFAKTGPG